MYEAVELRQQRAGIWDKAQAILKKAETEKRDLSAEERTNWDAALADMDALKTRIETLEQAVRIEGEMSAYRSQTQNAGNAQGGTDAACDEAEYRKAYADYLRYGVAGIKPEQRNVLAAHRVDLPAEARALGSLTGAAGGYTIPVGDMQPLVTAMIDWGGMRQARTRKLVTSDGRELPIPTMNDTANQGRRIGENVAVATSGKDPTFGAKVLRAYTYTTDAVLIPITLVQDTAFDLVAFLLAEFGRRLGTIENYEDTLGTGDSMPEGLVPVSTLGYTTASASAIVYNELVELEHSIYTPYRRNAQWMFADSTLKHLKQLKDGASRPLWVPGMTERAPDTILGYPYVINTDIAAIASSAKVMLFGDFSYFWQRDVSGVQVIRLEERYAEYFQVAYIGFHRHDAKYIDAGTHPIKHLIMHA